MSSFKRTNVDIEQFWIDANKLVRDSGVPNAVGCKIPVPTTCNLELFEELLTGYEDQDVIKYLKFGQ